MAKYKVEIQKNHSGQPETRLFDKLPNGTYFLNGDNDKAERGRAYLMVNDGGGCCLTPIIEIETNGFIVNMDMAGKELRYENQ
jgi:hypothetical protein